MPVDYSGLVETGKQCIETGHRLVGMCCVESKVYAVEQSLTDWSHRLTMYHVSEECAIKQLDVLQITVANVGGYASIWQPRPDRQGEYVFVPFEGRGVLIVHWDGSKLVLEKTLTCIKEVSSAAAISSHTLYACDVNTHRICTVDMKNDVITSHLEPPPGMSNDKPYRLAALGDTVLVCYVTNKLALYRPARSAQGVLIDSPNAIRRVLGVTTDRHSHFLITDRDACAIFVMETDGMHVASIDCGDSWPRDCAVVRGQLWVAGKGGGFTVMSSSER